MTSARTLPARQPAAERIDYLDAAKGIFIIFIIAGHRLLGADSVVRYLYSMGVAPFFLITGFLSAYKKEWEEPLGKTAAKKARKLLYPFVTFSVINLLWNVLYYKVVFTTQIPENSFRTMLLYTVTTYGYNALWYLPCVFCGTLLFFALRRTKHHDLLWAVLAVGFLVFYILFDKKLTGLGIISYIYCYLFRIVAATVILYGGSLLFRVFRNLNKTRENLLLLICAAFSAVIAVLYQLYPEQFTIANLAVHRMGNPYVYFVTAASNTTVILLLCKKLLKRSRVLTYFGRNSLVLMALHMDVTGRIAWWIFPKLHLDLGQTVNSIIVIGLELVMFPVIITVLNKCFPFVLSPEKRRK